MSLSQLPYELLEAIASEVPSDRDLNALVRVNRLFYDLLNRYLYRRNVAQERHWPRNVLEWAAAHGRVDIILRAESLGIALPAPALVSRAASSGSMVVVELFFDRVCRDDAPPDLGDPSALVLALDNGHFEIFKFLVERGADLEVVDGDVETALHAAAVYHAPAAAELLVNHGANLESLNEDGETPLHVACRRGTVDVVGLFLERGANVDARDHHMDNTPLHAAAWEGHLGVAEMLVRAGADIDALDSEAWTPLVVAVENGNTEFANMLIQNGAQ